MNSLALHVYLPPEKYIDSMAELIAPTTDVYRYYYNNIIHEYIDVSTTKVITTLHIILVAT